MLNPPQTKQPKTGSRPENAENLASFFKDRWICLILAAGLIIRIAVAFGLHEHFQDAEPPHVWPGTDEAVYYHYGVLSAKALREQGWQPFIESAPPPHHFNWMHYKYTALVLYATENSVFVLRILSIFFALAAVVFYLGAFSRALPDRKQRLVFVAMLCLLPSFAFWSALAVKEGVLLFLTALLCWGISKFWYRSTPWPALAWTALWCLVLGCFRIWAGIGFFVVAVPVLLLAHPGRPSLRIALPLTLALLASLWLLPNVQTLIGMFLLHSEKEQITGISNPEFNIFERAHLMEDIQLFWLAPDDGEHFPVIVKMLLAWVLPLPGLSSGSTLLTFAGFENVLFLLLSAMALFRVGSKLSQIEWIWLGFFLVLFATTTIIGANLGTIYRNKAMTLPFLTYFALTALPRCSQILRTRPHDPSPD